MTPAQKALALAESGYVVFPTLAEPIKYHDKDFSVKAPDPRLVPRGLLDATQDPGLIEDWWRAQPDSLPAVAAGPSGIVVLDIDRKDGIDGQETLDLAWLPVPDTLTYETPNNGLHMVYRAPEGIHLNPAAPYRKMPGLDRRGGNSYIVWYGDVAPASDLADAPEWLCDPAEVRSAAGFKGDVQDWYETLVPGEPNVLVRKAIERVSADMGHSEMVAAQYEAVRLGAEGNPGVKDLLVALEDAWLSRPSENHTTPQGDWEAKFHEALASGVEQFGQATARYKNLPSYSLSMVPSSIPDRYIANNGVPLTKQEWSKALGLLVDATDDDDRIATILWNAPPLAALSREWGLDFIYDERIAKARVRPEPTRENPALEEKEQHQKSLRTHEGEGLLSDTERQFLLDCPGWVDAYLHVAKQSGFANEVYFRSAAWVVASMAFAFRGFIPVSATDKMGLNLWHMVMGYSGTGKTRAIKFRHEMLNAYFGMEESEQQYNLGADSSAEGLLPALLKRDKKASFFAQDEATGFFKRLAQRDWMAGLDDTLSRWYEGHVDPSSKVNLKELKGKSALTSFTIHFYATPDRLTGVLNRDMFLTGFLARFCWIFGEPPIETDERFNMLQQEDADAEDFEETPTAIRELVADLTHAASLFPKPTPIKATREALARMSMAYKKMHVIAKDRENWDVTEPSVTRLAETMRKCAAISAMYRGSATIEVSDALVAIEAVEEWFENLFRAANMISSGEFQRDIDQMEQWVVAVGGKATKAKMLHHFRNKIGRDPRELEVRLQFLVESGRFNKEEIQGGGVAYRVNGG